MKLLVNDLFTCSPLKCGTRSIRAYVALAVNKELLQEYNSNKTKFILQNNNYTPAFFEDHAKNYEYIKFTYSRDVEEDHIKKINEYNNAHDSLIFHHNYKRLKLDTEPKYRVGFVRNPLNRFVSGFNMICKNSLGFDYCFQKFIDNFDKIMWEDDYHKVHFKQQAKDLGLYPEWYTHIFDNAEITSKFKPFLENLYNCVLPDVSVNVTAKKIMTVDKLTPGQVKWIKEKYAIDYRFYGNYFK